MVKISSFLEENLFGIMYFVSFMNLFSQIDILIGLHIRAGSSKLKKTTPESMGRLFSFSYLPLYYYLFLKNFLPIFFDSFFTCYADLLGDKLHEYYTFLATDVGGLFLLFSHLSSQTQFKKLKSPLPLSIFLSRFRNCEKIFKNISSHY